MTGGGVPEELRGRLSLLGWVSAGDGVSRAGG